MPAQSIGAVSGVAETTDEPTGDIDTTLVVNENTVNDESDKENLEFDYKTSMNNQNISSATNTKPSSGQTLPCEGVSRNQRKFMAVLPHQKKMSFENLDLDKVYHQFEVMKAQRDELIKELESERTLLRKSESEVIKLREDVEELKVENKILKKRFERKDGDYQKQYDVSEEKEGFLRRSLES